MKRGNRILRDTNFTKFWEQKMELILQYVWAPVGLWLAGLSKALHANSNKIAAMETTQQNLSTAVEEARSSRKEIYDKVETVRTELSAQHEVLRKEQREDFKEIRDLIVNGNSK